MTSEKQEATAATVALNNNASRECYQDHAEGSSAKRREKIAERRSQIPRKYQPTYDKAVDGNSRKAAMHVFCLECCGFQIKEVFACTVLGCPLYPYRPKSRVSQEASEGVSAESESRNSRKGVSK